MSPARAMLSWASCRVIDAQKESSRLFEAVQKVLMGAVESLSFVLDAFFKLSKSIVTCTDAFNWDARLRAMPVEQ